MVIQTTTKSVRERSIRAGQERCTRAHVGSTEQGVRERPDLSHRNRDARSKQEAVDVCAGAQARTGPADDRGTSRIHGKGRRPIVSAEIGYETNKRQNLAFHGTVPAIQVRATVRDQVSIQVGISDKDVSARDLGVPHRCEYKESEAKLLYFYTRTHPPVEIRASGRSNLDAPCPKRGCRVFRTFCRPQKYS